MELNEWDRALMLAENIVSGQIDTISAHGEWLEGITISATDHLNDRNRSGG